MAGLAAIDDTTASAPIPGVADFFRHVVPSNVAAAASNGDILPLVVFTVLFALAVARIADTRRRALVTFFDAVADALLKAKTGLFRTMPEPQEWAVRRLRHTAKALGVDWPKSESLQQLELRLDPAKAAEASLMLAIRRASQGVFEILPRDQAPGIMEGQQVDKTLRVVSTVEYFLRN